MRDLRLVKHSSMTLRSKCLTSLLLCACLGLPGCLSHSHRVGGGPNGVGEESMRQYYWFFGLFQLNEADHQRLTKNATSYEIVTEMGWSDLFLSSILWPLTVTTRSITVYR